MIHRIVNRSSKRDWLKNLCEIKQFRDAIVSINKVSSSVAGGGATLINEILEHM